MSAAAERAALADEPVAAFVDTQPAQDGPPESDRVLPTATPSRVKRATSAKTVAAVGAVAVGATANASKAAKAPATTASTTVPSSLPSPSPMRVRCPDPETLASTLPAAPLPVSGPNGELSSDEVGGA